jgi:hypothetical protein
MVFRQSGLSPSNKNPARAGFFLIPEPFLERPAASSAPGEATRADPARHHHDCRPPHHDSTGINAASAVGAAMEAGATSAGGIGGGAKSRDSGCNQSCCEKVFHVFSL